MRELVEHMVESQNQLSEVNWKTMAGSAALAGTLLMTSPNAAVADEPTQISQQAEQDIDMEKLLHAIKQVESSGGVDKRDRYEAGVEKQLRNRFSELHRNTRNAITKYGYKAVATSYGPYQIMASTAYDLGYDGTPGDLRFENACKNYATKYINWLIARPKTKTLKDVISAYNAGLGGIGSNPNYVNKVLKYYS